MYLQEMKMKNYYGNANKLCLPVLFVAENRTGTLYYWYCTIDMSPLTVRYNKVGLYLGIYIYFLYLFIFIGYSSHNPY